jgi:hypothetical protein
MWQVEDDARYLPIYLAGFVIQAGLAGAPDELERLLRAARNLLGSEFRLQHDSALAGHVQRSLAIGVNQAGCILGEILAWKFALKPLPAPALRYRVGSRRSDPKDALAEVAEALRTIPAGSRPETGWRTGAQAGPQRALPGAPCLRASLSYSWAPADLDKDDNSRGWLDLECVASEHDGVWLTFYFEDELGWQFDEAWRQADRCVNAVLQPRRHRAPDRSDAPGYRPMPNARPLPVEQPASAGHNPFDRRDPTQEKPSGFLLGVMSGTLARDDRLRWLEATTNIRQAQQLADMLQPSAALSYADAALRLVAAAPFRAERGFLRLASGDRAGAKDDFSQALSNNVRCGAAHRGAAAVLHAEGKLQQALACCNSSLVAGLADGLLFELRGTICHDLGNFQAAVDDYMTARRLLGECYLKDWEPLIAQAERGAPRTPLPS